MPAPNMLMTTGVVKMTEMGGNFDKGYVEAELDINPDSCGFSHCDFIRAIPVMRMPWAWTQCGSRAGFYLGWLGGEGKGRALGVGEVNLQARCC
ncbi:hypothetical protein ACNKHM_01635 [Shigella sonnei]